MFKALQRGEDDKAKLKPSRRVNGRPENKKRLRPPERAGEDEGV
jgi:hypothetical protein